MHSMVHLPHGVPLPKKEAMKTELDKIMTNQIIAPVTEHPIRCLVS